MNSEGVISSTNLSVIHKSRQ